MAPCPKTPDGEGSGLKVCGAAVEVLSMASVPARELRRLQLRYPSKCSVCSLPLSRGSDAWYDDSTRKVVCLACGPETGDALADDAAGRSAAEEGERRVDRKVERVRDQYGDYAAEVAKTLATVQNEGSWGKGSKAESELARSIRAVLGDQVIPLHDRLIPGSHANIDHIWVTPTGVWVVDAKAYTGKVERREVGPMWRRDNEVFVKGRNRTKLANGVLKQVDAVLAALKPATEFRGIDVHAALCFVGSEWGLLDSPFQVGNVWIMYPRALRKRLQKAGPVSRETMTRIARRLELSLPPAA